MRRLLTMYAASPMFRWGARRGFAVGILIGLAAGAVIDHFGRF